MPLCLMLDAVLADLVGDESGERFAAHVRRYAAWVGTELGVAGRPGEVQPAALAHGWWNLCEDGDGTIRPLAPVQAAAGGASVSLTFAVWRMLKGFAARNRGELPGLWKGMRPDLFAEEWAQRALDPSPSGAELVECLLLDQQLGDDELPDRLWLVAMADEVIGRPALLEAYAAAVPPSAPTTLMLYAPGADEAQVLSALQEAMERAGILDAELPDMLLLPLAAGPASDRAVRRRAVALLSARHTAGPFADLPRFSPEHAAALAEFVNGGLRVGPAVMAARYAPVEPAYRLAICTIFHNEAPYLAEWIEFHRLIGVEHFWLYDNESSDDWRAVLAPYIEQGLVTVTSWPGAARQQAAYEDCLRRRRHAARWIAIIDADEFLWSPAGEPVLDVLERHAHTGGVRALWAMFGTGGHATPPEGGVVESYLRRDSEYGGPDSQRWKSVLDPRGTLSYVNPHTFTHLGPGIVTGFEQLRVNHYWTKSEQECRAKFARGRADQRTPRPWSQFEETNARYNRVEDCELAERYGPLLRRVVAA